MSRLPALLLTAALAAGCSGAAPANPAAPAVVAGTVTDASGAPVPGASVFVADASRGDATDTEGAYALTLPAGTHTVRFSTAGADPVERRVTLRAGGTVRLDVALYLAPASASGGSLADLFGSLDGDAPEAPAPEAGEPAAGDPPGLGPGLGFAYTVGAEGLLVTAVAPGGPAERTRIAPGAVLVQVGLTPLVGLAAPEAAEVLAETTRLAAENGQAVTFTLAQGRNRTVQVTPAPYSRDALAGVVRENGPIAVLTAAFLDPEPEMAALNTALGAASTPREAKYVDAEALAETDTLVVTSETCEAQIPLGRGTTFMPVDDRWMRVVAWGIRSGCGGALTPSTAALYDFATESDRDAARRAARRLLAHAIGSL